MKPSQVISGAVLLAVIAGAAVSAVRQRIGVRDKQAQDRFDDLALSTFEGEGGLVI